MAYSLFKKYGPIFFVCFALPLILNKNSLERHSLNNATNTNREEQPGCRLSLSMHGHFSENENHTWKKMQAMFFK